MGKKNVRQLWTRNYYSDLFFFNMIKRFQLHQSLLLLSPQGMKHISNVSKLWRSIDEQHDSCKALSFALFAHFFFSYSHSRWLHNLLFALSLHFMIVIRTQSSLVCVCVCVTDNYSNYQHHLYTPNIINKTTLMRFPSPDPLTEETILSIISLVISVPE